FEPRVRDALLGLDLAAHRVGGAPLERVRERGADGVGRELVDAPDEARAVETTGDGRAEWLLRFLACARPDVGVADQRDGLVQDRLLRGGCRIGDERLS